MLDSFFEKSVLRKLASVSQGSIELVDGDRRQLFGHNVDAKQHAVVRVNRKRMFRRIALRGDLGAAESYIEADWDTDDLTALIRIMVSNLSTTDRLGKGWAAGSKLIARCLQKLKPNNRRRAKLHILQHYDLGNEFFASFLDRSMSYSSGIFYHPEESLEQASYNKLSRVCRKLQLNSQIHLLEIGTGWGELAIFAAKNYGCRVTTTTISDEQFKLASQRIREAGVQHLVTIKNCDYRDLSGKYDRVVSIEMIEAVGHKFLETFFKQCDQLLNSDGFMVLQGIVIRDQRLEHHINNIDFMRGYIFPGGCLPSVTALTNAMTEGSELRLLHLEDIVAHYPPTLRAWRENLENNLASVRKLGLDENFIRMWRFYLCYCEAAFLERQVNNIQAIFAKTGCRLDPTQIDYSSCDRSIRHDVSSSELPGQLPIPNKQHPVLNGG